MHTKIGESLDMQWSIDTYSDAQRVEVAVYNEDGYQSIWFTPHTLEVFQSALNDAQVRLDYGV